MSQVLLDDWIRWSLGSNWTRLMTEADRDELVFSLDFSCWPQPSWHRVQNHGMCPAKPLEQLKLIENSQPFLVCWNPRNRIRMRKIWWDPLSDKFRTRSPAEPSQQLAFHLTMETGSPEPPQWLEFCAFGLWLWQFDSPVLRPHQWTPGQTP